jgi:hypothetical protein
MQATSHCLIEGRLMIEPGKEVSLGRRNLGQGVAFEVAQVKEKQGSSLG